MESTAEYGDPRLPQRFWDKVWVEPVTDCWMWKAQVQQHGYPLFYLYNSVTQQTRPVAAATYAWAMLHDLPLSQTRNIQLDHHAPQWCGDVTCVNPAHKELRAKSHERPAKAKALCRKGLHPMEGTNLRPVGKSGSYTCRACSNESRRRWRAERKKHQSW